MTIDFCSSRLVVFIIIFVVLMKNRISSENVTTMKVLKIADLMYYRIDNVENTQAQYFDNEPYKEFYASVLKNVNIVMHHVC